LSDDNTKLDDGKQYMNYFSWGIVKSPELFLLNGRLPVLKCSGLVFESDWDAISLAGDLYSKQVTEDG